MSEVKVNKISPRSGTEVTLGDSGDTFTIPSGATINNQGTATNFGATGSASWNTTVKTGDFTAVAGEGYFINTTGGAVTVNLPAGTAGAVVAVKDYANTFDTNAVILNLNGSDKAGGTAVNPVLSTEGIAVTLVFIDSTQGWLVTDSGLQNEAPGPEFITATGGTITTVCTDYKVHTFTGPGTFTVCSTGNPAGSNTVSYMVVAGGGGGAGGGCASTTNGGGGGGAGGFRESKAATDSYTASPLNATTGPGFNLPVSAQGYPITVGAGAATTVTKQRGAPGSDSIFSTITSAGGGGGACGTNSSPTNPSPGLPGGSGGGGGWKPVSPSSTARPGGSGNTPSVSPPQGTDGGNSTTGNGGGGGGATAVGTNSGCQSAGGPGGAGATSSINGTPTARAGGGGGGRWASGSASSGGPGGGGAGGSEAAGPAGTINTGGGGGGAGAYPGACVTGGAGGSGIVIIRYKFQ
jgi:hypothetical protein